MQLTEILDWQLVATTGVKISREDLTRVHQAVRDQIIANHRAGQLMEALDSVCDGNGRKNGKSHK